MGKEEFDRYLQDHETSSAGAGVVDWEKERDAWLDSLDKFYEQVENYLSEYRKAGKLSIEYEDVQIEEESISTYSAKMLRVNILDQSVTFKPVGTNLIGAKGRVDMKTAFGSVRFVLVDRAASAPTVHVRILTGDRLGEQEEELAVPSASWTWKIATPPPDVRYLDLNKDSFFDALMEVLNA